MQTVSHKLVYLLQRRHEFKIGHTQNLKQRLAMLSTGSAVNLKIVHTIRTERNVELENLLKSRFAANRLNREWFLLNDEAVRLICSITTWPTDDVDLQFLKVRHPTNHKTTQRIQQGEISFEYHSEKPLYHPGKVVADRSHSVRVISSQSSTAVQELFRRYGLEQRDLTRIAAAYTPPISRSYVHYIWQGQKPPSAKVILAIHEAHPEIPATELLQLAEDTRKLA